MFQSDLEVESLLTHPNNSARVAIMGQGQDDTVDRSNNGRTKTLTGIEKINIAKLAMVVGIKGASILLNKTPGVVGRIASGENSQGVPDSELRQGIEGLKTTLKSKALTKADEFMAMVSAGDTKENLQTASTIDKLVSVFERLEPKVPPNQNNTQIVFYAPKPRESADYTVIEVNPQG